MKIKEFNYSANFCEENIWHLCQNKELEGFTKNVLVVSNAIGSCPFRFQKSVNKDKIVWWNYHVILWAFNEESSLMYDFDSTLEVPLSAKEYFKNTFEIQDFGHQENFPFFKAIDSETYLNSFSSDRSHMKDPGGKWISDPPNWQMIGQGGNLSLKNLLDFTAGSKQQIHSLEDIQLLDKHKFKSVLQN